MRVNQPEKLSPQMERAVNELKTIILERFPDAQFVIARAPDTPESFHLLTTVDIEDTDEVIDLVIDRIIDFNVEEGIPIYVIPLRPLERVLASMRLTPAGA